MCNLKITYYKAVIQGYRNFPDITFTINEVNSREELKYHAESDYAFWGPSNPINPYRHDGYGATIEKAVRNAMNTFITQDVEMLDNSVVFITDAKKDYHSAIFIDGNGKKVSYDDARAIVLENKTF